MATPAVYDNEAWAAAGAAIDGARGTIAALQRELRGLDAQLRELDLANARVLRTPEAGRQAASEDVAPALGSLAGSIASASAAVGAFVATRDELLPLLVAISPTVEPEGGE